MIKIFLLLFLSISVLFASTEENLYQDIKEYKAKKLLQTQYTPLDLHLFQDYTPSDININKELSKTQRDTIEDTVYMQVFMLGTMGVLLLLPESVSKWDLDELNDKSLSQRWKENVKAGPVVDEDDWGINYIGHPVSGAWYYMVARNNGAKPFDSFLYSFFISTFIWEYGYEAFAEIPSIQDLIATPVVGALMGEGFFYLEALLDENRGLIWGNKTLGSISYFFLDPIGNVSHGLSGFFDVSVTMRFQTYNSVFSQEKIEYDTFINTPHQFAQYDYGVVLDFKF
jgi:hypothetical protein